MIKYLDAYENTTLAAPFLWKMMEEALTEPHTTISHQQMPTLAEHHEWLRRRTQRVLLLIQENDEVSGAGMLAGFVSLTHNNEIGIRIAKGYRAKGYGKMAVQHLMANYDPLPGVPSVRAGRFIANINPANEASIALFLGLGGRHIQNTYAL